MKEIISAQRELGELRKLAHLRRVREATGEIPVERRISPIFGEALALAKAEQRYGGMPASQALDEIQRHAGFQEPDLRLTSFGGVVLVAMRS